MTLASPKLMRGLASLFVWALFTMMLGAAPAIAQTPPDTTSGQRPATTTTSGDTGLWFVPTAEVLRAGGWSFSLSRLEGNEGQGFSNISHFPISFGVGIGARVEVFGGWRILTRLDRDARPLFFPGTTSKGTGGGLNVDFPLDRTTFTSHPGDMWIGAKIGLLSQADGHAVALAIRPVVKLPVGDSEAGTSSGQTDFAADVILSKEASRLLEISGYGGFLARGNPSGYALTNGITWGFGAGFPSRSPVRITMELYGEHYIDHTITAPAGLFGTDGSAVPTSTSIKSPAYLNLGATFQLPQGFFIGIGANWNLTMPSRDAAGPFKGDFFDASDYQVRLGYHPGARRVSSPRAALPAAPMPAPQLTPEEPTPAPHPATAAAPAPAPPINHPPTVRASCNPCRVEIGKSSTVTADAYDADGDVLSYAWKAATGTLQRPTERQSPWQAPMQIGAVPITVTVNDGKGGTASDTVTIDVIALPLRTYTFEDVYFDFDRYTLLPDALHALDEVVLAMQDDPTLNLDIVGYTCDVGTPEYNLALSQRRATAVERYLQDRGIQPERLRTKGLGQEQPKYDNSREETRRLNRRVALTVALVRGN